MAAMMPPSRIITASVMIMNVFENTLENFIVSYYTIYDSKLVGLFYVQKKW